MVVCKFFLQGTCKFGSYCHFEHQVPNNYNYTNFTDNSRQSASILRQPNFGNVNAQNAKAAPTTATVDVNMLVKSVVADMTGAEKGGQWLLSCYAPFKEKPAFPGFEDQSPEEIRWGFYEAQKNGTMDQYKQQLQQLFQNTIVKIRALQNPTSEVTTILQNIYSTPASTFSGTYGQTTSNTNNSFSQQQSSNIFATQFGQTNTPFGTTPTTSIFGGSQPAQAPTNIFASAPATTSPPNQNIFANATSNIFANSTPNPSNLFAAPTSNLPPFGGAQQQSTNIFAKPTQPQNMFTSQPVLQAPQNMFVSQAQPQQPPNNMFGVTPTPSAQQSVPPPNYSASIFGNTANTNPTLSFGQSVDENLYSKLEDLSAEEKKWFESDTMDILNIPDKPPTYDMCFKM